ncbi:MAG: hypothetical protein II041_00505 [Bacteroidales bacterium]|nr:hypothetical protein [Bacteroidales bacterium]
MATFKKTDGGKTYNSFPGKLRVLSKEDEFLYKVEVWLLNSEVNRNNWQYLNLDEHRHLFADTPILVAYTGGKVGDGHNFRMKRDENGEAYASFTDANAERIVGWFKNDSDIRIEEKDGVRWIVGDGTIWSYYARELADLLTEQGAEGMDVSIETLVENYEVKNGVEVFENYQILGTTILGKGVNPAVAGAHIHALSLEDDLKDFKLKVASYMETAKETIQKGTKRMALNKVQLEALNAKFNGYKIVGTSEDGNHIALLSEADNCFYGYTLNGEEEIVAENIKPVNLNAEADFGDDVKVALDAIGAYVDQIKALTKKVADLEATANEFESENKALKEKETNRRNKAVVAAIKALLKAYNAEADEPIDDKACADIVEDAENGEFSDCENAEGEFCGEEKACSLVKARIFDHESAIRAKKNAANAAVHSWLDGLRKNSNENSDSIEGLLSRIKN